RSRNIAPWQVNKDAKIHRTKVAILNGNGAHDEVVVSFVYALRQINDFDVALYWDDPLCGIDGPEDAQVRSAQFGTFNINVRM
ncbi:hypothetical protein BZG36_05709, partial [Bifiguratus adelaidae]